MGDDERRNDAVDDETGMGEFAEPGDAGSPLSDEPSTTGVSDGTPNRPADPEVGGPNETPRREQGGL